MAIDWRAEWAKRPWWMSAMMVFCAYMALVYVPFDFFWKPVAQDEEIWFGLTLHGWAAKATEPLHWAIYAAGAWGFWHMRSWMWPWAPLYVLQIAIGMLVWGLLDERGPGLVGSSLVFAIFCGLAWLLHRARPLFQAPGSAAPT